MIEEDLAMGTFLQMVWYHLKNGEHVHVLYMQHRIYYNLKLWKGTISEQRHA